MIEPSLAIQRAICAKLQTSPVVIALVDRSQIRDGLARPASFPSIIVGDGQTVLERIVFARKHVRVFLDLHVWTVEEGLAAAKTIAAAVAGVLADGVEITGFGLLDFGPVGVRYLRDPSGKHGHAVVSVEALVEAVE